MGPFHILLDEMGLDQMGLDKVGIECARITTETRNNHSLSQLPYALG